MKLFKNKVIKVDSIEIALDTLLADVANPEDLQRESGQIFETDDAAFLIPTRNSGVVYRLLKAEGQPRILKAEKLELNPDSFSCKVQLSKDRLFAFAKQTNYQIVENAEGFYIISSTMVLYTPKARSQTPCP